MDKGKRNLRVQKFLSQAGMASRREAEGWIREGRVEIHRKGLARRISAQIGEVVDPDEDGVFVDGVKIRETQKHVYYLFHKPKNVMVTRKDPENRPTIYDYLKGIPERVNYVGRLDFDSEGLILLTNDGTLHHRLTHPGSKVTKKYQVEVSCMGTSLKDAICQLASGINIGDYVTAPCEIRILSQGSKSTWVEMTLTEGKQRQIRRMWDKIGFQTLRLIRVAIGPLNLGDLSKGRYRKLDDREIQLLEKGPIERSP